MSKRKKQRRSSSGAPAEATATKTPAAPRKSKATSNGAQIRIERQPETLLFGRVTYRLLGIGFALVVLGFLLMLGGRGDDPAVFDEDVIYSFRKVTLAPIVILSGLGVVIYGIFQK